MDRKEKTIEDIDDDSLYMILSHLPFLEKVKNRCVSHKWREILTRQLRMQRSLGNEITRVVNQCSNSSHYVGIKDLVPKPLLTNLSALPLILRFCPELKAIAITNVNAKIFEEAASEHRGNDKMKRGDEEDDEEDDRSAFMEERAALYALGDQFNFFHPLDDENFLPKQQGASSAALEEFKMCRRMMVYETLFTNRVSRDRDKVHRNVAKLRCRRPSPRRCNEEDFLCVLAKYAPKLECIDISGLKLYPGSGALGDGGTWKQIALQCRERLCHIRTHHITDNELNFLFERCPNICDIGAASGVRGISLSNVRAYFERLSIYCLRLPGLEHFANVGPQALNLKSLALNNVNKDIIQFVCNTFLNMEKLSFRLQVASLTSTDLGRISNLHYLRRLSLKRRESDIVTNFDEPFLMIMKNCPNISTIILRNLYVSDTSVKLLSLYCRNLKEFTVAYTGKLSESKLVSDISLCALTEAKSLTKLDIDYPNTISENGVIGFLLNPTEIDTLRIQQCREFIPDPNIIEASTNWAKLKPDKLLRMTISTNEKIEIHYCEPRLMRNIIPKNLFISINTGVDNWRTDNRHDDLSGDESEMDIGRIAFDWED